MTPRPKTITWIAHTDRWTGEIPGTALCFHIEPLGQERFRLSSTIESVRTLVLRDLAHAQTMAQEQFDTYARNLFTTYSSAR